MDCIILAGGLGTRLQDTVPNLPKPLAPIGNRPFLEILLKQIEKSKVINRVIFSLGYKASLIDEFVSKRNNLFTPVFVIENKPLGTGGAVQGCIQKIQSNHFFVMNGDSYLELNWEKFLQAHIDNKAYVTLACTNVSNAFRFGTVVIDSDQRISCFKEKKNSSKPGIINGGIYCFKKGYLPYHSVGDNFSIETDIFPQLIDKNIYGFLSTGAFIDIGTAKSFKLAQKTLEKL